MIRRFALFSLCRSLFRARVMEVCKGDLLSFRPLSMLPSSSPPYSFVSSRLISHIYLLNFGSSRSRSRSRSIRCCHSHQNLTIIRAVISAINPSEIRGSLLRNAYVLQEPRQHWQGCSLFPTRYCVNSRNIGGKKYQHSTSRPRMPLQNLIWEIEQRKSVTGRGALKQIMSEMPVAVQQKNPALQTGSLIEFERDNGNIILAVVGQPFGKRNWMAEDQHKNMHSVRPTQISFVVPGIEDFKPADIQVFLEKSVAIQDPSLMEPAWEELSATGINSVDSKVLAKVLFGTTSPEECYAAHSLLSCDQVYFRCSQKGNSPTYVPRPLSQVNELRKRQELDEASRHKLDMYTSAIKAALLEPFNSKPSKDRWYMDELFSRRTAALKAFSLNSCHVDDEKLASEVLLSLGMPQTPASAVDVLIGVGIFPLHVNLELLRSRIRVEFSKELLAAAELIMHEPFPDMDLDSRDDLTSLAVYTIDSEDTKEIDDGLSATLLPGNRIKLWIHVADPTRWINPEHPLEKEARQRGTSVYLPTQTISMFPMELAGDCLSLKEGLSCAAITVSVVLKEDGSIEDSTITCSVIRPTCRLSYHEAHGLLLKKENTDLNLLSVAANLRQQWRNSKGAVGSSSSISVKVSDAESVDPCIHVEILDHTNLAFQLVSEMMILCGEAVSMFGEQESLMLPYRGHLPKDLPVHLGNNTTSEVAGSNKAAHRATGPVGINFSRPIEHISLGLSGYVQFTSPIRRYNDFIAHYQVKAALRGDKPFFSHDYLEAAIAWANLRSREAKKLEVLSNRYWILEFLRRQPKDKVFPAVIMRFVRNREAFILLKEVGMEALATISSKAGVGDELKVIVKDSQPRRDLLLLKEVF